MISCPRCKKANYNTFTICRFKHRVPVNKCVVCGFLWIADKDLVELAEFDVKRMFLQELLSIGKQKGASSKR